MRRALHLFLLIAVFACGLHVAEPVQAHGEAAHHLEHAPDHEHGEDGRNGAADAAHAAHHHCPVAPDGLDTPDLRLTFRERGPLFPAPAGSLASLTRAPPVEPPAA